MKKLLHDLIDDYMQAINNKEFKEAICFKKQIIKIMEDLKWK